jgi:leucyl/phenylalanyl-tRNA---protein transferase
MKPERFPASPFPDPRLCANEEGLIAVGALPVPSLLMHAYRQGIYPWPAADVEDLLWFCPPRRAILRFDELHVPRRLERKRRQAPFRLTRDQAFPQVIQACADAPRPGQSGTWITPEMVEGYVELHRQGLAHSVEAWEGGELVAGVYGVDVDGVFAGESMFHRRPDASKLALLELIRILREGGVEWLDIQMLTPHMEALGAREIPRDEFLDLLARARARGLRPWSR